MNPIVENPSDPRAAPSVPAFPTTEVVNEDVQAHTGQVRPVSLAAAADKCGSDGISTGAPDGVKPPTHLSAAPPEIAQPISRYLFSPCGQYSYAVLSPCVYLCTSMQTLSSSCKAKQGAEGGGRAALP